ncbi:MAG: hypothetical protein PHW04_00860 [Candidatus Wallbacteria bacterium]|nr:hypothetical protein [Candidatus Wallbacteria bacterium]
MKRNIPLLITFCTGIFFVIAFFAPALSDISDAGQRGYLVIAAFALLVAILNLLMVHSSNVYRQGKNWGLSVVLIFFFFFTSIVGFLDKADMDGTTNFSFVYNFIYNPLQATMFSLLAFYVSSASFRAFRIKTKEATLMMIAGFFVMLGRVPIGSAIWDQFPTVQSWIMNYFATGAMRAITIGVAIGAVSMSIKIIFGLERAYLGGGD